MGEKQIQVTVIDLKTGEAETIELADDYVLIVAGECYLSHTQVTKKMHVLTVKGRRDVGR